MKYLIVHHSGGTNENPLQDSSNYTFDQCNNDHRIRFDMISSLGYYVGYQYFIDKNGIVRQARLDTEEGAHTIGHNHDSIGICLAGNFDLTLPTDRQIESLKTLLLLKQKEYNVPTTNIVPHRMFANKTCYGNKLDPEWAARLVYPKTIEVFDKDLSFGQSGDSIRRLQTFLKELGYFPYSQNTTGFYGEITRNSVYHFQQDHIKLTPWEYFVLQGKSVGPKTRLVLNKLIN